MTSIINQKEYLKKYLRIGKAPGEKKKKKKDRAIRDRLKIIDDDDDVISKEIQEDLSAVNEDAPQIVAIIDERPPSKRIDEQTNSKLWTPIGQSNDNSPPRRRDRDSSPSRRYKKNDLSPLRIIKMDDENCKDYSPPRRYKQENSSSPRRQENVDLSPQRACKADSDRKKMCNREDISPPRRNKRERSSSRLTDTTTMVTKHKIKTDNKSPVRDKQTRDKRTRSRWTSDQEESTKEFLNREEKIKKTLDGKKAGLQSAKDLVKETAVLRQTEDELFKNMPHEISGMNAATVVRERSRRDVEEEARQQKKKEELQEKYDCWGKGLKQVEDQNKTTMEQLHEMSKPLARYADDEDLERYLKEQEREGDPMLAYIRKKKKKERIEAGISEKPTYMGEFMPNRFGICPGYRWDGVDRSNGYENKWFQMQNSKKANQEEALKWSTEDM